MELAKNEDMFVLQYIADALKKLMETNIITLDDLYICKEQEIVDLLKTNISSWKIFEKVNSIERSMNKPNSYYVSKAVKKRYVIPLCIDKNSYYRLDKVDKTVEKRVKEYLEFSDSTYAYIDSIITL